MSGFFQKQIGKQNEKDKNSQFYQVFNSISVTHLQAVFFEKKNRKQNEKEKKIKVSPSIRSHHRPIHHRSFTVPPLPDGFLKKKVFDIVEHQINQVEKCEQDIPLNISKYTPRKIILYMVYLELGGKEARPANV